MTQGNWNAHLPPIYIQSPTWDFPVATSPSAQPFLLLPHPMTLCIIDIVCNELLWVIAKSLMYLGWPFFRAQYSCVVNGSVLTNCEYFWANFVLFTFVLDLYLHKSDHQELLWRAQSSLLPLQWVCDPAKAPEQCSVNISNKFPPRQIYTISILVLNFTSTVRVRPCIRIFEAKCGFQSNPIGCYGAGLIYM